MAAEVLRIHSFFPVGITSSLPLNGNDMTFAGCSWVFRVTKEEKCVQMLLQLPQLSGQDPIQIPFRFDMSRHAVIHIDKPATLRAMIRFMRDGAEQQIKINMDERDYKRLDFELRYWSEQYFIPIPGDMEKHNFFPVQRSVAAPSDPTHLTRPLGESLEVLESAQPDQPLQLPVGPGAANASGSIGVSTSSGFAQPMDIILPGPIHRPYSSLTAPGPSQHKDT